MKKLDGFTWYEAIFWIIVFACFLILFTTGCHVKQKHKEQLQAKLEINQVKTYVKTTVIDTTVAIPGSIATVSEPLTQILNGDTLRAERNGTSVVVYFDKKTGNIHAKGETVPRTLPIHAIKTESGTEQNNIKSEVKQSSKDVTVKSDIWANVKVGVLLVIACVLAFLFIRWRLNVNGII